MFLFESNALSLETQLGGMDSFGGANIGAGTAIGA
jgi:hypothetical protein